MSGGASRAKDPFAGYVPVKPAIPVVDCDVPDIPRGGRIRRRKLKRERHVVREVRSLLVGLVSVALIAAVSVVTYGFVYGQPTEEMTPEFVSYVNRVRPLVVLGRTLRAKFGKTPVLKSVGGSERPLQSGER